MSILLKSPVTIDDTYIGKSFTMVNSKGEEVEDTVQEFVTIWMAKTHRKTNTGKQTLEFIDRKYQLKAPVKNSIHWLRSIFISINPFLFC